MFRERKEKALRKIQKMLSFAKCHISDVSDGCRPSWLKSEPSIFLPIKWDPIWPVSAFPTKPSPTHTHVKTTHPHCDNPSRSDCLFQPKSDDWSQVMWVCGGGELVGAYEGGGVYERCGSCFDLSEMCAADKHNRSFHSAPAAPPTPRPTRQLNPSLCVPHSCMDLSALGRGAALCGGGGAGQR